MSKCSPEAWISLVPPWAPRQCIIQNEYDKLGQFTDPRLFGENPGQQHFTKPWRIRNTINAGAITFYLMY